MNCNFNTSGYFTLYSYFVDIAIALVWGLGELSLV